MKVAPLRTSCSPEQGWLNDLLRPDRKIDWEMKIRGVFISSSRVAHTLPPLARALLRAQYGNERKRKEIS